MAGLTLRGIEKSFGDTSILEGIDLDVDDGELVVLVGPSGCGKSTLLRTIAGLEKPDAGAVRIGDRDVTHAEPRERDIAMVFQSYALYPHLTVRDNLAFGLKLRGEDRQTISDRIAEVSKMLGLGPLLDRLPRQLSGGQRQRVAMGRAIARRPSVFLFDEPLSNLDAALRAEVRVEIKRLHASLGATMVYVTHDQVEAMTLADKLVILNGGRIEQQGRPLSLYEAPRTKFVAAFMGSPSMNFLDGDVENGRVTGPGFTLPVGDRNPRGPVQVGVRPHDTELSDGEGPITLRVEVIEAMGFEAYAHGKVGDTRFVARIPPERATSIDAGQTVSLSVDDRAVHLFDPESDEAL